MREANTRSAIAVSITACPSVIGDLPYAGAGTAPWGAGVAARLQREV
jgi:hypothetical protein